MSVKTIDGRSIVVKQEDIVTPGMHKAIPNEGMPIPDMPGRKGESMLHEY